MGNVINFEDYVSRDHDDFDCVPTFPQVFWEETEPTYHSCVFMDLTNERNIIPKREIIYCDALLNTAEHLMNLSLRLLDKVDRIQRKRFYDFIGDDD